MSDEKPNSIVSAAPAAEPVAAVAAHTEPAPAPERHEQRPYHGGGRGGHGGHGGQGGQRRGRRPNDNDQKNDEFVEKTIHINRSAKVVKGGRRFSFSALVVIGDRIGKVGLGLGKGNEVSDALRKGGENARGQLTAVSLNGGTIPHEVYSEFGGAKVLLRPASPGTGLICGPVVRKVVESAGVKDVLSKSLGSKNPANVAKATLAALHRLRSRDSILKSRGLKPAPASSL